VNGDKLTRWTAFVAVLAVAAIAALISYRHAVGVVIAHGEPGMVGRLYPVVIDGLIIAASMVLLDARAIGNPPRLWRGGCSRRAWWRLWLSTWLPGSFRLACCDRRGLACGRVRRLLQTRHGTRPVLGASRSARSISGRTGRPRPG
jgi:hypothetical protein